MLLLASIHSPSSLFAFERRCGLHRSAQNSRFSLSSEEICHSNFRKIKLLRWLIVSNFLMTYLAHVVVFADLGLGLTWAGMLCGFGRGVGGLERRLVDSWGGYG